MIRLSVFIIMNNGLFGSLANKKKLFGIKPKIYFFKMFREFKSLKKKSNKTFLST